MLNWMNYWDVNRTWIDDLIDSARDVGDDCNRIWLAKDLAIGAPAGVIK